MISKGTTHNSGGRLARYLVNGKEGERAELYELRGFASDEIVDAFRSVHVIAEATKCERPFFHVQVRCPEGEQLTPEQWAYTANRIERMMGLSDQPRAIAFHTDEKSGDRHMHVAWSRIDDATLTAKPLPFYKERLKKVSRELELHFDLTLVPNERESSIKYAPTRAEDEQARRLGVDIHATRQLIRDCYEKSDCGRSFETSLAGENFLLAKGDRRDFVVVDHAGGTHALGKRILGVPAKDIRAHLADLDPNHLLTVTQAQERAQEQTADREKTEPVWDRDAHDSRWLDAVVKAAIEKEKVEKHFIEPRHEIPKEPLARSPFAPPEPKSPPHPYLNVTPPDGWFADVAREATRDRTPQEAPDHLKGPSADIWLAYNQSHNAGDFSARLESKRISLACVTKEEADQSHREASFAKAIGNFAPEYREGEIVAVTAREHVIKLNVRTTGEKRADVEKFLSKLDRKELQGIAATKDAIRERQEIHELERQAFRDLSAVGLLNPPKDRGRENPSKEVSAAPITKAAGKGIESIASMAGAVLELFGDMFGATEMTEERILAAIDAQEKASGQAEAELALGSEEAGRELRNEHREFQELEEQKQRDYYEEQYERQR